MLRQSLYDRVCAKPVTHIAKDFGISDHGVREQGMRQFKSVKQERRFKSFKQVQRFVGAHAAVQTLFNLGKHLVRAQHYRDLRVSGFNEWRSVVA